MKSIVHSLFGHAHIWQKHKRYKYLPNDLFSALNAFQANASIDIHKSTHKPLLILSAGWRSGSTLLQRALTSGDDYLIWGEPYGDFGLLESLTLPLTKFNEEFPRKSHLIGNIDKQQPLSQQWIANLYPQVDDLKNAYTAYFEALFQAPAESQGYTEFGIKEIRLDAQFAQFFKWLFLKRKSYFWCEILLTHLALIVSLNHGISPDLNALFLLLVRSLNIGRD